MILIGPFMITFSLTTACFSTANSFVLNLLVYEKETKMRESLRIMSMQRLPYATSFLVGQSIYTALTSFIFSFMVLMFWFGMSEATINAFHLFLAIFCFGLSLMSVSMFMSTFFTDSKLASQLGNFILYLPVSLFFFGCCEHAVRLAQNDLEVVPFYMMFGFFMP